MNANERLHFLDNLRTFLIFLVVVNHAGWVYEQSGVLADIWIVVDAARSPVPGLVNIILDLFIMPTIFFISGYFTPASLQAKGDWWFLKTRFRRLIIPWLIAVFTLMPLYKFFYLFSRGLPQEHWTTYFHFSNGIFSMSWLWFLPALFLFDCVYLLLSKLNLTGARLGLAASVAMVFVLGFAYTFAVGALDWIGWTKTPLIDFQNERLLVYFLVLWLGAQCYRLGVLETGRKNLKLYIAVVATLWIPMNLYIQVLLNFFLRPGRYIFSPLVDGTLLWLGYHLSMLGLVYCLVTTFQYYFTRQGRFGGVLGRLSYNVYIIHVIVMAPIAMALVELDLPAIVKYPILFSGTWIASNLMAWAYARSMKRIA